jgi:hypothetical protein
MALKKRNTKIVPNSPDLTPDCGTTHTQRNCGSRIVEMFCCKQETSNLSNINCEPVYTSCFTELHSNRGSGSNPPTTSSHRSSNSVSTTRPSPNHEPANF